MSYFKSILSSKSVGAVGKSLHFTFEKIAMASAGRQKVANEDDPWKVSAVVSALMELFLSVLLLLGAAIAFITSQLVNYFDLDPPCTYIGCSHTQSRKKRPINHGKEEYFYKLCPDCRSSCGYTKQHNEKSLCTEDDTEISSLQEGDDFCSNNSSTSTSDVDVPHLDEDTCVTSDFQLVKKRSTASGIQNFKKVIKLRHVKSRTFKGAGNASHFINEDCVPFFSKRSVSAFSIKDKVEDYCERLATSMDKCRMPNSCQGKILQKKRSTDDNESLYSCNDEYHYMLLENEDEVYEDSFSNSFEAVSGREDSNSYIILEGDDKNISETINLHSESAQPLLSRDIETILEEEKGPSMVIESAEASNICKVSEECKDPNCEGEQHYILLEGDDEEAQYLQELLSESAQPLLNSVSDGEPDAGLLSDSCQSLGIELSTENSPYHELIEGGIQTIASEVQQHQYMLLGSDGDSSEAPDSENVLSGFAEPLLQVIQEGKSKAPSLSLKIECAELAAKVGDSHGADIKQLAEDNAHCELAQELHSDSAQALLNTASDNESDVGLLSVSHQSSGIELSTENSPYHKLLEGGIQTIASEVQQHQYMLLGSDDEDSSEAPDSENVLSAFAEPLLQVVQERESAASSLSFKIKCAELAAKVGDSHGTGIKQLAEDNAHCELPEARRVDTYSKRFIKLDQMQVTEAPLQGFSSDQGSEFVGPPGCNTVMVKGFIESDNHLNTDDLDVPLADLEIVHGLRKSKKRNAEEPLLDMETGCTELGNLLEVERHEGNISSDCESQIIVTGEALLFKIFGTEFQKQGSCSEETPRHELFTGICNSDLEELGHNNDQVPLGSQQQVVDQSELCGKDLASNGCTGNAATLQDVCLFETQGQLDKRELSSSVCLSNDDANRRSVAADGWPIQEECTNELNNTGTTKIILEASFERAIEGTVVCQLESGFKGCDIKNESTNTTNIMDGQQGNVKNCENILDALCQTVQQDKEEIQVDKDQDEGLNVLREALWDERKMLVALETELENERNAAAIATSEAMAMISRLQEEKSAMQLEVAQLQRMAEEKAEYDEQAMALLKEILFRREAEKHALEKEVELYRERFSAEKVKKTENKDLSMWSSASLLLPSRMDEDQGPFSPAGRNIRLKNLPSLDESYKSENTSPPRPSKRQNIAYEESTEQTAQFSKSPEARSSKDARSSEERVDTNMAEDKGGSAIPLIEHLGTSKSIFSTNDEETQFILDRLWVLEEELRELRGVDGLGAAKKSFEVQYMESSPVSKNSTCSIFNPCLGRAAGGHADENGIGACLPVHDVYEVHSAPSQQVEDNKGGNLVEDIEAPKDSKSFPRNIMHEEEPVAKIHCNSAQVVTYTGRLFLSDESRCDSAIIANQVGLYADNGYAQFPKTTEGELVSTDVIQQLAVRLQVLETDRELLREILESFRHKDAELKLLQEIAQQLRELRAVGFSSISTGAPLDPMSATFGKNCTRALKKRRYCSEPGQAEVILLHQRSI